MNQKAIGLFLVAVLVALSFAVEAQQPKKVYRIGYLSPRLGMESREEAFRKGLHELGYVEGQNIVIEWRFAKGKMDLFPVLAAELVRLKVDVIVAGGGTQAIKTVKNANSTIPIVMTGTTDPVATGFVVSLARPGGNITGLSLGGPELSGKRLELLRETVPKVSRVAVFSDPTSLNHSSVLKETRAAAQALGLQIQSHEVRDPHEFESAFQVAVKGRVGALSVGPDPLFTANRKRIVDLAAKNRLPAIYVWRDYVEDGGLMSYAANLSDLDRRAATYVDKILKGAKPAELPVEQPMKFELVINLKAAKQIGLTIPPNILARADRVIR